MGQAKIRKNEINALKSANQNWLLSLDDEAKKTIADVALRAHENIVVKLNMTGACYLLAMFLARYLSQEKGIEVTPVVGYVNDGTGQIMTSHAWIEYDGMKTDISLTKTEYEHAQLTGDLLIHNYSWTKGKASYTYHYEQNSAGLAAIKNLLTKDDEMRAIIQHKEQEHQFMQSVIKTKAGIDEFLASAPSNRNYQALASYIRK